MRAWFSRGKIHFDQEAWDLVLKHARRQHKSPRYIVLRGLKRGLEAQEKRNGRNSLPTR